MSKQQNQLGLLLSPSWLSGLAVVVVSLGVVLGSVALLQYRGSSIQLLRNTQSHSKHVISTNTDTLDNRFSTNQLVSDIPLFIFWAGVGLVAYSFTINTFEEFRKIVDFEKEMNYVHANRNKLKKEAARRFGARVAILILWFLFMKYTTHVLLPYVIALSYAGGGTLSLMADAGYLIGAIGLLMVGLHIHVIFLRLVLLRARVFNQPSYS